MVEHGFQLHSKDAAAKLCNQTGGAAAGDEYVWGKYREATMKQTKSGTACAKVKWQVHTKASFGASPVTSQLRWARLDVTGLAGRPHQSYY